MPDYSLLLQQLTQKLLSQKQEASLTFLVTTDSHLDDNRSITCQNLKSVSQSVSPDFLIHLGDFLNGSFPRERSLKVLREEMDRYLDAAPEHVFYPVQGNHDGFVNQTTSDITYNVTLDEDWYAATSFTEQNPRITRTPGKSYYYVDYPAQKVRLVILAAFSYQFAAGSPSHFVSEPCNYEKLYRFEELQISWLAEDALQLPSDWTVLLFSHDGPLKLYDQARFAEEPWNGNNKEILTTVLAARRDKGFSIAGWFVGHWHGDLAETVEGIPFILTGNQTSYVPWLWTMPDTGAFAPRIPGTVTEELWDAVILNTEEHYLELFRFGAGSDRKIFYSKEASL